MNKVIVEVALVKYNKKGEYDYTIESNYKEFKSEKEARDFINKEIEKDYEFYLYKSQGDVEKNEHFDVVISNNILKERIDCYENY